MITRLKNWWRAFRAELGAKSERVEWYKRATQDAMVKATRAADSLQDAREDAHRARNRADKAESTIELLEHRIKELQVDREVIMRAITGNEDIVRRFMELEVLKK